MEFPEFLEKYENQELREKREIFPPLTLEEDDEDFDRSVAVFYNFGSEEITTEYLSRVVKSCEKIYNFFIVAPSQTKKNSVGLIDRKATAYIGEMSKKSKPDEPPYRFEIFSPFL